MEDSSVAVPKAHRLDTSRDNEILQRFVRINLDESEIPEEEADNKNKNVSKPENVQDNGEMEKLKPIVEQKVPRIGVNIIEKEVTKKGLRKRRRSRIREEENYTDKDRAAAVNMGTRDIKQSLKLKRKQDRSKALAIPEEAEPGTFLALGNYEMGRGDLNIALDFMTKVQIQQLKTNKNKSFIINLPFIFQALELNPTEKNALVARSKCYLLLGQPENGLKDAETALSMDKSFIKALFQKAESLYYLGDFEHSLMYYHRGLKVRPDHEGFKLGVQKAQKAIENAIGGAFLVKVPSRSATKQTNSIKVETPKTPTTLDGKTEKTCSNRTRSRTRRCASSKKSSLLRELGADKDYLDNLLNHPDLRCQFKENDNEIIDCIKDAVEYLNKRQEFWRQQLPPKLK
ncbi:outer dynein arm-docking complex subunit 4 [Onthophagus taurus]|uniref:outer dynein arm-docking complex subunit 4 n=1 Tax=Onthophagus taurus TaxID=166361 RepID=UPI0039BDA878